MPDSDATPCPRRFASGVLLLVSKYLDSRGDVNTEGGMFDATFCRAPIGRGRERSDLPDPHSRH